jgi:hypothetical protein
MKIYTGIADLLFNGILVALLIGVLLYLGALVHSNSKKVEQNRKMIEKIQRNDNKNGRYEEFELVKFHWR